MEEGCRCPGSRAARSSRPTARRGTTTTSTTSTRPASCSWAPRSRPCARAGRRSPTASPTLDDGEVWLERRAHPEYTQGTWTNHETRRKRKLLLHRDEIEKIDAETRERGLTIVPLSLYFKDGRVKVEIGVARGKKNYDKRQALRERQDRREADRAMSLRVNR